MPNTSDLPEDDCGLDDLFLDESPPKPAEPDLPRFLHHNVEASRQLGLPDSPTIHLAITKIADRLMLLAPGSPLPAQDCLIQALRTASGAALFRWPMESAEWEFRLRTDQVGDEPQPELGKDRPDWLGQARAEIIASGEDPGPDARRQASPYGWRHLDEGQESGAA